MNKFTAADARVLAGPSVEDHVNEAIEQIKKAAENKRRSTNLTSDFWVNEGYGRTNNYKQACKQLEALGFTVKYFYEELQFVNAYTIVSW